MRLRSRVATRKGETVEDALESIREAIEAHLVALREEGQPDPRSVASSSSKWR
jgi:predicted RNase H-like HicB family nuclease